VTIPGDYGRRTGDHGALEDPVVGLVSENSEPDIGLDQDRYAQDGSLDPI
jgi:hypothetical protein